MSTSTTSSTIFVGNSRYSSDFQAVIDRSVAIASLPISQLKAQKTTLDDQTTALTGLEGRFTAIQSALDQISNALGGSSFDASISDSSKLSVTLAEGAQEGQYSVKVVDPGTYAASLSTSNWVADPGTPHPYRVSIAGVQRELFAYDNSAASVAAAINTQFGSRVRAIVVNVGSSETPDYRISMQATELGDLAPQLSNGTTNLQTQQTVGTLARYIVNGSGSTVTSNSRSVTIASGITVNLAAASATPVDITVTRSTSALSSALDGFATAFNAAVDELDKHRGTNSGALAGQSLVTGLSGLLGTLVTYDGDGSGVGGMQGLGLELDKTGHLTFQAFTLLASDLRNSTGVTSFLGAATTGGFLRTATDTLRGVLAAGTGLLPTAEADVTTRGSQVDASIAAAQDRIDLMKVRLQEQMAASDALIASMEQQYNYLSALFASEQTAAKLYE